jgi:hypothetical protein
MKDSSLNFRLSTSDKDAFIEKSKRYYGHTWVLRELVRAFIEDRVTIEKPQEMENFYVTRDEN